MPVQWMKRQAWMFSIALKIPNRILTSDKTFTFRCLPLSLLSLWLKRSITWWQRQVLYMWICSWNHEKGKVTQNWLCGNILYSKSRSSWDDCLPFSKPKSIGEECSNIWAITKWTVKFSSLDHYFGNWFNCLLVFLRELRTSVLIDFRESIP